MHGWYDGAEVDQSQLMIARFVYHVNIINVLVLVSSLKTACSNDDSATRRKERTKATGNTRSGARAPHSRLALGRAISFGQSARKEYAMMAGHDVYAGPLLTLHCQEH
jgi:hypothetical protein